MTGSRLSILTRATPADIRLDPYPHLLIDNALPDEVFEELAETFPSLSYVAGEEAQMNNKACLKTAADVMDDPSLSPVWREFFDYHLSQDFFQEFAALWGETIETVHPGIEENFGKPLAEFEVGTRAAGKVHADINRDPDLVLDCVFGVNTPVTSPTPVRGPHIDSPYKLFSSLLYFRTEDDHSTGGEHQMFRLKKRVYPRSRLTKIPSRYVEPAGTIPYRANTLLFWLNSSTSIHSVTPRGITNVPRRYVAVAGECYGGQATEGFFAHHPQYSSPVDRLRNVINL